MKKRILIICISVALFVVFAEFGVFNALMAFFLVGAIPGTSYSVPSLGMLLLILASIWFLIFQFTTGASKPITPKAPSNNVALPKKQTTKKSAPASPFILFILARHIGRQHAFRPKLEFLQNKLFARVFFGSR